MKCAALALVLSFWVALSAVAGEESPDHPAMTREKMEAVIRSLAPGAEGVPGAVAFEVNGVQLACISDTRYDRMRIIAMITPTSKLTPEQVGRVLEANFHTALDARYATSEGYLYAAFIHPLSPLSERELRSAAAQVANLAQTFGTGYSGGELEYGGEGPPI